MSRARRAMVQGLFAALLLGTALAFRPGASTWPLTRHPMFSHGRAPGASSGLEIVLVGDGSEAPLPPEAGVFFRDFDAESAKAALRAIAAGAGGDFDAAPCRRFLALLLADRRDDAIRRGEPPPRAVRVDRVRREIRSGDPHPRILERTPLVEVSDAVP